MVGARVHLLIPLVIAATGFWVHREVLDLPIFGLDGQAAIIASRIQGFQDFIGTFREVMMDGRLAVGDFYRPVGNLFLAFDYAVWDVQDFGYQLTSLLVWCAVVVVVYLLVRRMLGGAGRIGPALAALFFALHPAALSVLPYPARRTETLGLLFIGLALFALPRRASDDARRRYVVAGVMAMLAVASKETAAVVVPLIFLDRLLEPEEGGVIDRVRRAVVACVPAAVLTGMVLIVRGFVIGGLGGYHAPARISYVARLADFGPSYAAATLTSGAYEIGAGNERALVAAFSLLAACGFALLQLGSRRYGGVFPRASATFALAGVWGVVTIGLACMSFQLSPRYMLPMVFAAALGIGATVQAAAAALRAPDGAMRGLALGSCGLLAGIFLVALDGSALKTRYPELQRAGRIQRQLLVATRQRLERSEPWEYVDAELMRRVPVAARAVDDVWMIGPWGLQAWLELVLPERAYKVAETHRASVPHEEFWSVSINPVASQAR